MNPSFFNPHSWRLGKSNIEVGYNSRTHSHSKLVLLLPTKGKWIPPSDLSWTPTSKFVDTLLLGGNEMMVVVTFLYWIRILVVRRGCCVMGKL